MLKFFILVLWNKTIRKNSNRNKKTNTKTVGLFGIKQNPYQKKTIQARAETWRVLTKTEKIPEPPTMDLRRFG